MKSKLSVLTKKELLLNFGMRNPKKEPNPLRFFLIPLLVAAMLPMVFMIIAILRELHSVFAMMNQTPAYIMLVFMAAQIFLLFTGIPAFAGRFYGNRDNPILLPMPIEPGEILLSRFVPVLFTQLLTALVLLIPALAIHARRVPMGLADWAVFLSGLLGSLIFPTVLSAVMVLLIMRYTNIGKHSDKIKTIGTLFLLALLIGFQAIAQGFFADGLDSNILLRLLTDNRVLIESTATLFLPARWTGMGMAVGGSGQWLYAGLNLMLAFLAAWLLQWLGSRVYLKSLLSGSEVAKEKKTRGEKIRMSGLHPIFRVLITEWRILTRTPAFAINVLSTPLIVSVVWLIPLITNKTIIGQLAQLRDLLLQATFPVWIYIAAAILVGAAMGVLMSVFVETSTSFTREGQAFWIRRILPIRPHYEIIGRSLLNVFLTMGVTAILALGGFYALRYPLWLIGVAMVFSGFFSLPLTFTGLIIDIHRPKLHWDDPNQAVKQNLNSLFAMIAAVAYILLLIGSGYLLFQNIHDLQTLLQTGVIVLILLNTVLAGIAYLLLLRTMPKAMIRIE